MLVVQILLLIVCIDTIFVHASFICRLGENTRPIVKGKVSAYAGPVEKVFSPVHVSLSFMNRYDIEEDVIKDKVTSISHIALKSIHDQGYHKALRACISQHVLYLVQDPSGTNQYLLIFMTYF